MMKVKSMLELTANENPADLVSKGNVSLGMSHPIGPHDHAKLITNRQISNTTTIASVFPNVPFTPKSLFKIIPTPNCAHQQII